jgi:hypothetical protein
LSSLRTQSENCQRLYWAAQDDGWARTDVLREVEHAVDLEDDTVAGDDGPRGDPHAASTPAVDPDPVVALRLVRLAELRAFARPPDAAHSLALAAELAVRRRQPRFGLLRPVVAARPARIEKCLQRLGEAANRREARPAGHLLRRRGRRTRLGLGRVVARRPLSLERVERQAVVEHMVEEPVARRSKQVVLLERVEGRPGPVGE